MRSLTSTLLAAQKNPAASPYVKIEAKNLIAGVVRCDWARLYDGPEDDCFHALTVPADGSLVRARITLPADSRKLYRQRVESPSPGSDFSQWTYTGQYNALVAAAAALGAEVSIFWINSSRQLMRIKSADYGVTWDSPELIDYSPTTAVYGLAAAYKPGGDMAVFFADQSTLYVKKHTGGSWQAKAAWDRTTGDLSGVGCSYGGDWDLVITGQDTSGNYKLWSLVYGDSGDVPAGSWSELKEVASAPSGGDYEYRQPFLDNPDVFRCFFVEKFTGNEAYNRPFWTHSVPGAAFIDSLWREPVPFDLSSEYGLALAHGADCGWLSAPAGVWRADLTPRALELTADVTGVRQELGETGGSLTVELRNDDGRYSSPGEGNLDILDIGCQLDFSPGYITSAGAECSTGQAFSLGAFEHTSAGGKAGLVLYARDGWDALSGWRARNQFRWNKDSDEMSVREIIAFILARVGIRLETVSESSLMADFYPDFTINPGNSGDSVILKLQSLVPDVLFIEGNKAYALNPLSSDGSVYGYGVGHPVQQGRYRRGACLINRVLVEGYDPGGGDLLLADSYAWDEINRVYDRLRQVDDRNLGTVSLTQQRGMAILRKADLEIAGGSILVPVNCAQQLYDVVSVTDSGAGLIAEKKRVRGMALVYSPSRGEYSQRLELGKV